MADTQFRQLNPFELKSAVTNLLNKINSVEDLQGCLADFDLLDAQDDKKIISKILFKELVNSSADKIPVICFMLEHFLPKEELINKLWETLKNQNLQTEVKITVLNLLRDLDSDWSYESCEEYLDDAESLLDENTKHLLNTAVINPEVQIDFMDFMASLRVQDKITLLNSFGEDFSSDALANILIPVFVSEPDSPQGREALRLLGDTKSQLALHALEEMKPLATGELLSLIKKSLSTIKISGMREDNTKAFYKEVLSNSKPHKFYITYPDGRGDQALIFTRITDNKKIRFVSVVINVESGIRDCFGFFEISEFECSKILERFLRDEKTVDIDPESFKTILYNAEVQTIKANQNKWKLPYEYVCWKNLLIDVDFDAQSVEEIINEQVIPSNVDDSVFEKLAQMKVSAHWFMDCQYSSEFEEVLAKLKSSNNLDELVENNLNKVFDEKEQAEWIKKIYVSSYIKYVIGKEDEAGLILGITKDEKVLKNFFAEILKRSIYEYLMLIKYNTSVDNHNLTHDEINDKINYIESRWVHNV
ncbi:hypothetical protein IJ541_08985 [bacterium]|nr:hypothetical protein [bacterium]MBQ9246015.1 hypothetical protein [bacterium]MBQ9246882.1 hypothetical protein [bacterium]